MTKVKLTDENQKFEYKIIGHIHTSFKERNQIPIKSYHSSTKAWI